MGLETGTFVNDLVQSNPLVTDQVAQGANHLQLIKKVLQNTFPNATRAFPFPVAVGETANYGVLKADFGKTFVVDTTSGAVTLTLPTLASGDAGWWCQAIKVSSDASATIFAPPTGTINGVASVSTTTQYSSMMIVWDGASFWQLLPIATVPPAGSITGSQIAALTITNSNLGINSVSLSNLQTQADSTILANIAGGTAVPTAATLSAIIDHILGNTQGSILYRSASAWTPLAPGTSGQFLETQGAGANPIWAGASRVLLNTLTAASSANLSDTTSFSGFTDYEVVLQNVVPAGNFNLGILLFVGGTFQTSGYKGIACFGSGASSTATSIPLCFNAVNSAADGLSGSFRIVGMGNGNAKLIGQSAYFNNVSAFETDTFAGYYVGSAPTGIRLQATSGNLTSGIMRIYGLK